MSTKNGARGSWRAQRAIPYGLLALFAVLAVGLASSPDRSNSNRIVLSGYGSSGPTSSRGNKNPPATPHSKAKGSFGIAGSVKGLYPGLSTPLVLTVSNRQSFAIVVTSITTSVTSASAPCSASMLSVSSFSGRLSVPAMRSAKTSLVVKMRPSAPDACIGATFRLAYSGLGDEGKK